MISFFTTLFSGASFHGFEAHLLEAVDANEARMALHTADGRAVRELYEGLIRTEQALVPVARGIDALAAPFVADGVPVVVDDFVSLDGLPAYDTPADAAPMRGADRQAARDIVVEMVWAAAFDDLSGVTLAAEEALGALSSLEVAAGLWFPMTRHTIESAGYAALHGMQHNCASGGGTRLVVEALVRSQLLGLSALDATGYDEAANPHQVDGVGVLRNDLPAIPFEAELEALTPAAYAALVRCGA